MLCTCMWLVGIINGCCQTCVLFYSRATQTPQPCAQFIHTPQPHNTLNTHHNFILTHLTPTHFTHIATYTLYKAQPYTLTQTPQPHTHFTHSHPPQSHTHCRHSHTHRQGKGESPLCSHESLLLWGGSCNSSVPAQVSKYHHPECDH